MSITRRHLAVAGVLALGGLGLLRSPSAVAESADEAAVAQAIEALRKAIFGQDKTQLEALCAEQLSYGHSGGRVENKAQFIEGVMTRKAIVKSIPMQRMGSPDEVGQLAVYLASDDAAWVTGEVFRIDGGQW